MAKVFKLTEMAAEPAEEWAGRILLALTRAGIEVPADMISGGMASVAALQKFVMDTILQGVGALNYDEIKPLLQKMMD